MRVSDEEVHGLDCVEREAQDPSHRAHKTSYFSLKQAQQLEVYFDHLLAPLALQRVQVLLQHVLSAHRSLVVRALLEGRTAPHLCGASGFCPHRHDAQRGLRRLPEGSKGQRIESDKI